jgi:AGZA family xanthine/uracil permease-like MFS transporter
MTYITGIITRGRLIPEDEDHREYWTWKPAGTLPWFIRAAQDPHNFFHTEIREGGSTVKSPDSTQSSFAGRGSTRKEKDLEKVVTHELPHRPSR